MSEARILVKHHHITTEEVRPNHIGGKHWFDGKITTSMLALINAKAAQDEKVSVDDIRDRLAPLTVRPSQAGNFIVARGLESHLPGEGNDTGPMLGACILKLAEVTTDQGKLDEVHVSEMHIAPWADEAPIVASMMDVANDITRHRQIERLRIPADVLDSTHHAILDERRFLSQENGSWLLDLAVAETSEPRQPLDSNQ